MATITEKQREVLERGGVDGHSIRYQTTWVMDGRPVTRTVNTLIKRGLMSPMYFSGSRAAANITDAGREAIQ